MKFGSKNIQSLYYGSRGIVKAMFGSKLIWEKFNAEEDINTILKSIIDGNELNNMSSLLSQIESSNKDFSDINAQLEEIIGNNSIQQSAQVGDIAYWDGSSVKTTPLSSWNTSLGTPVGVVMIGEGFAPDGRARIIGLDNMTYDESEYIPFCPEGYEGDVSSIPKFKYVPTTDNAGSTTNGIANNYNCCLPSDDFTGVTSFVDSKAKYSGSNTYIPSPYLGDAPNPAYYQAIEGGNALSDFNGLSNTQSLVNAGDNYHAAHVCWKYKDATIGIDELQWYLPSAGELGYLVARLKLINESIQAVGGNYIKPYDLWTSSIFYNTKSWFVNTNVGRVTTDANRYGSLVKPVALV